MYLYNYIYYGKSSVYIYIHIYLFTYIRQYLFKIMYSQYSNQIQMNYDSESHCD